MPVELLRPAPEIPCCHKATPCGLKAETVPLKLATQILPDPSTARLLALAKSAPVEEMLMLQSLGAMERPPPKATCEGVSRKSLATL